MQNLSEPVSTLEAGDTHDQASLAKRIATHYEVAEVLSKASSLKEAMPKILRDIGETHEWDLCLFWRMNDEDQTMVCDEIWCSSTLDAGQCCSNLRHLHLPKAEGFPGHVWTTGKQVWIEDYFNKNLPVTLCLSEKKLRCIGKIPVKMHCIACIPIKLKGQVLGAMEFVSRKERLPDPNIQETMTAICTQIGHFLERNHVTDALRESEARYRLLADAESDVLITFDEDGSILFANQSAEDVFGYTDKELLGKNMELLVPGFRRHVPTEKINGEPLVANRIEASGRHKSGGEISVEVTFAVFLGTDKRYSTGIIRDIGEHKRTQSALLETERKLQSVLAVSPAGQIVAEAPAMLGLLERVKKAAASYAGILIQGETGSGKECIALTLHQQSPRADKAFVARNCAAIPANLFESEMFGHKKGSFTGADKDRKGAFLEADGGTLFLDEIGDLEYNLQTKLLRAIQEKVIRPVGSDKDVPVDPRIICATNKDLRECCKTNEFREDLYYRLVTVVLVVPPLRERREDIIPLARHFVGLASKWVHSLSPAAEKCLLAYPWPGNVRELRSLMDQAVIFAAGNEIQPDELNFPVTGAGAPHDSQLLAAVEQRHILQVLKNCHGNKSDAAKALGLARSTLVLKLKGYPDQASRSDA